MTYSGILLALYGWSLMDIATINRAIADNMHVMAWINHTEPRQERDRKQGRAESINDSDVDQVSKTIAYET